MESSLKTKDYTVNTAPVAFNQTVSAAISNVCVGGDSFSIVPPQNQDLATSMDLNAAASLSDDSGVPLTTNSSISSGDSYKLGLCKFEIEIIESDGEVSQFDSLDNCSEGGMSAENFNTLKKGPLAPIDPPPEFQDSPQSTFARSIPKNLVNPLRRWTSQSSIEHIKYIGSKEMRSGNVAKAGQDCSIKCIMDINDDNGLTEYYAVKKHICLSDPLLNSHADNIYDEPNNVMSNSLGNSVDIIESDSYSHLPPPPPPVSQIKIKKSLCPYYQDHTRYFKAIPSEQDNITTAAQKFNLSGLSEIHDYDLYYGVKRGSCYQNENSSQRRIVYSPLTNSHNYHNHHYHTGFCSNRPNSRNSLNSRLSSSHNSLSIASANKPDDSIFITQAMSHDALLSREISDFYNVPIDSDIYAFPIDMIQSDKGCLRYSNANFECHTRESKDPQFTIEYDNKLNKSNKRNRMKRRKRSESNSEDTNECTEKHKSTAKIKNRVPLEPCFTNNVVNREQQICQEILESSINDSKQFYHILYSDDKTEIAKIQNNKSYRTKIHKETKWGLSSARSRNNLVANREIKLPKGNCSPDCLSTDKDKINNNNINTISNHNDLHHDLPIGQTETNKTHNDQLSPKKPCAKETLHNEKKSQFTLSLKQKFCSIFRFRKSHSRCHMSSTEEEDKFAHSNQINFITSNNKQKKFQSRALPPLPNKSENSFESSQPKHEHRSFQFTSSIEKVKDYGWYWGPLSSEAAEKVLSNEPDGSFIVRDSSDDHYIFSLSFKLNNCVRHVRIEQDQGTFSFGSYAKFKSQTITEFIEKAVEHSRSGRYLFFLHRRPEHGPMRVQLTNPVSRLKHVQSLQHMCRFVILKAVVRKDLIQTLPLPRRLLDYLSYKHCYSEQIESDCSHSQISEETSI